MQETTPSRLAAASVAILASLASADHASGQDAAWTLSYRYAPREVLHSFQLAPCPDGGVVLTALGKNRTAWPFDGPGESVLVKFSENGDREWAQFLPSEEYGESPWISRTVAVDVSPSGVIYWVTNSRSEGRIRAIDGAGATLWSRTFSLSSWQYFESTAVDASVPDEIVLASTALSDPFNAFPNQVVHSLRADGTTRWRVQGRFFASSSLPFSLARGVKRGPSGEVIVWGQTDSPAWGPVALVGALDALGAPLWEADLGCAQYFGPPHVQDVAVHANGGVTALLAEASPNCGPSSLQSVRLTGFDATGVMVFETIFRPTGSQLLTARTITVTSTNELWVGGSSKVAGVAENASTIFRFGAGGTIIASIVPGAAAGLSGVVDNLVTATDGTVYATGTLDVSANPQFVAAFAPDGTELWSRMLPSVVPDIYDARSGGIDAAVDGRGNLFALSQVQLPAAGTDLSLGVTKIIDGSTGTSYCGPAVPNSTGVPAELMALGTDLLQADNVTLLGLDLPPGSFAMLLASRTAGLTPQVGGGQGTLCLGGSIGRYVAPGQIRRAGADGQVSLQINLVSLPQPTGLVLGLVGETWRFQAWYRDANPSITSNLTDGVAVLLR